jgi:hypothetical protein
VPAVLSSMQDAMSHLSSETDSAQQEIVQCLRRLAGGLDDQLKVIDLPRPDQLAECGAASAAVLNGKQLFYDR